MDGDGARTDTDGRVLSGLLPLLRVRNKRRPSSVQMQELTAQANDEPHSICPVSQSKLESIITKAHGTSAVLDSVSCEVIGEGKGFFSIITKVRLNWSTAEDDTNELPRSIILKKASLQQNMGMESIEETFPEQENPVVIFHNRECRAYKYFTRHQSPPFPMARCYLAEDMTDEAGSGLLILEDLTEVSRSIDLGQGTDIKKLMIIVEQIASLQAYGFAHPEFIEEIGHMPSNIFELKDQEIPPAAAILRKHYPQRFKLTDEELIEKIAKVRKLADILQHPGQYGYTEVLCLGDVQPNNILWMVNEDGSASNQLLAILDFQTVHVGVCSLDIGILAFLSLSSDQWRQYEDMIFQHYLNSLCLKCSPTVPISMKEVKEVYQIQKRVWNLRSLRAVKDMTAVGEKLGLPKEKIDQVLDRVMDAIEDL